MPSGPATVCKLAFQSTIVVCPVQKGDGFHKEVLREEEWPRLIIIAVNVANYSLESFDSLLKKLKAGSKGIKVLKFYSQGRWCKLPHQNTNMNRIGEHSIVNGPRVSRSVTARGQPSNETSQGEGIGCDPFGHESYIAAVDHASWVAQHARGSPKLEEPMGRACLGDCGWFSKVPVDVLKWNGFPSSWTGSK
eukprot:894113-Pelagomonas_calceolata.AAC.3